MAIKSYLSCPVDIKVDPEKGSERHINAFLKDAIKTLGSKYGVVSWQWNDFLAPSFVEEEVGPKKKPIKNPVGQEDFGWIDPPPLENLAAQLGGNDVVEGNAPQRVILDDLVLERGLPQDREFEPEFMIGRTRYRSVRNRLNEVWTYNERRQVWHPLGTRVPNVA